VSGPWTRRLAQTGASAVAILTLQSTLALAEGPRGACDASFSSAPDLVKQGRLRAARDALLRCSSEPCPAAMRPLCAEDLRQLEPRVPTVVLIAKGADGFDLANVRVTEAGQTIQERLDGRAVEMDPGAHSLQFERQGSDPVVVSVLVHEGEKARQVVATFSNGAAPPPAVSALPTPPTPAAAVGVPASATRPVPWTVYAVGGGALAATGTFAYFGLHGLSQRSVLDACRGSCDHDSVQAARTSLALADASWIVAAIGYAAAATLFLTRPTVTATVGAGRDGAMVGLVGHF
jgi:hypothetical protein